MPHKHSVKVYVKNSFYHIYNRGVEKRTIFQDDQDYKVFLHLLKYYLSPPHSDTKHPIVESSDQGLVRPRPLKNLHKEVELHAFCLMPNHFHLLIKQIPEDGMTKLIRCLASTYSMYFNKRYDRVGYLFQGRYKAAIVTKDEYLLHLSRYIHLNPFELTRTHPVSYPYSSYQYYLGKKKAAWVKSEYILNFFSKPDSFTASPTQESFKSYEDFVENSVIDPKDLLGSLTID